MQSSCLCPESVPLEGQWGPAAPLTGGSEMGVMLPWLVLPGLPAPAVLILQAGILSACSLPSPCCPSAPGAPPGPQLALPKGPSALQAAPSPSPPISPPPSLPLAAGAGCRNRGTLFRVAMLRCWASCPLPILLRAGVQSLAVSRLFTDIPIFCITFPSFLLPFQSSKPFEVQL